jgi:hypothetical protein
MAVSLILVAALSNVTAVIVMVVPLWAFLISPGPDQHCQITASGRHPSRH